ncbi:hypothetical protein JTB14_011121 [Gonioctena quinquepunctata]|nr:hypothetical protein JTB14_011121 [Gonioctena quinquepunctata]
MPRVRVRKTSRGQIELSRYRDAYEEVKAGDSLRNAADKHGINYCSLLRYIRKRDASGEDDQFMGYRAHNRIFNEEQEQELSKYLIRCADIYFGLPKKERQRCNNRLSITHQFQQKSKKTLMNVNTLLVHHLDVAAALSIRKLHRDRLLAYKQFLKILLYSHEAVRPLPKAPPRKSNKGRKTRKSTIYTDTPEKEAIRKEQHETRLERIKSKQVKKSLDGRKGRKILQEEKKVIHSRKCHQKRKNATVLFVCHHIQKADPEKSGFNASLVNSGLTKNAQKVVLAMFATIATQIDPYAKL